MYRNLCVVLLVAVAGLALTVSRSAGSADLLPATPQIIRRVALTKQTAAIPTTTLFTPSHNGIYRVSMYMTATGLAGQNGWGAFLSWADDAGVENTVPNGILATYGGTSPSAYARADRPPGGVSIIEAVAGQPVTYNVILNTEGNGGTYSLYIIVERLAP